MNKPGAQALCDVIPRVQANPGRGHDNRSAWRNRYSAIRHQTLALARPLSAEDQLIQSMPDASPTKWHLGHMAWFFETFVLSPYALGYQIFDGRFTYLFNSYYDALGARHPRPQRGIISRPDLAEVHAYRLHVDEAMDALISCANATTWDTVAPLIELGLNHEQQHQELILMDIKHALSLNPFSPAYLAPSPQAAGAQRKAGTQSYAEGLYAIGHAGAGFAFDNEGPIHKSWLDAFALANDLVTAGEWQAFIADGAYSRPEFWLSDGWAWAQANSVTAPLYWKIEENVWRVFTLEGLRAIDPAEPVCHVSFYEADAFARWAGARLPREAEWEVAAASGRAEDSDVLALHPRTDARGTRLRQMTGGVWQWTSSPYAPYPRFVAAPGAVGEYNGKFMSGQMVLRGSACVTPPGHTRPTYRNFFPPAARWAFGGLRLAYDL